MVRLQRLMHVRDRERRLKREPESPTDGPQKRTLAGAGRVADLQPRALRGRLSVRRQHHLAPLGTRAAAHCVYRTFDRGQGGRYYAEFERFPAFRNLGFTGPAYLQAVLGTDDLRRIDPDKVRNVGEIIVHPGYDKPHIHSWGQRPDLTGHDLALLRLARPWDGAYARLALKPSADPRTPPGASVMVAGFGNLEWLAGLERFEASGESAFAAWLSLAARS